MRPEQFPIGSPESRAAARMLAQNRRDERKRSVLIVNVDRSAGDPEPPNWNGVPHASPWQEDRDELFRELYIPTLWYPSGSIFEPPACPQCGTPYRRYPSSTGWIVFEADCLEKHVPGALEVDFAIGCGPTPPQGGF